MLVMPELVALSIAPELQSMGDGYVGKDLVQMGLGAEEQLGPLPGPQGQAGVVLRHFA